MASSFGTTSSSGITVSCRWISPAWFTETVIGWVSAFIGLACVSGKSIGTPTVSSGAATMKMMSSTSMTSTNGVTLISDIRP